MSVIDIVLLITGSIIMLIIISSGFYLGIKGLRGKDLTSRKDKEIFTKKALAKYSKFLTYYYLVMSSAFSLMVISFFIKSITTTWISAITICISATIFIIFLFYINFAKGYKKKKR